MAFLPLHLLLWLSRETWVLAAPNYHHLSISARLRGERSLWQRIPLALVQQIATSLTQLISITFCHPSAIPLWCFDVFLTVVESHVAGRRAANMDGGTLRTITIEKHGWRSNESGTFGREHPARPPLVDPPPTLSALTAIKGLSEFHFDLGGRGWLMPSLEEVTLEEDVSMGYGAAKLGQLIDSSHSVRRIDWCLRAEWWVEDVFERMPTPDPGQPGPLRHLEAIGTIDLNGPCGINESGQLGRIPTPLPLPQQPPPPPAPSP